ncbi:hypothetical protein [Algoriphagus namhaensis]
MWSASGGWITSCKEPLVDPESLEGGVFQVWKEMQQIVQTSPDCLSQAYARVRDSGDPEAMLEFVRDSIYLIPAHASSLRGMNTSMRFGTRGVLRDGFATPREKAELLHQLLKDAGIQSEVIYERTDFDEQNVKSLFFRPKDEQILEEIDDALLDRWMKMLQLSESDLEEISYINAQEKEAEKLAEKLWQILPDKEAIRYHDFDFRWDNSRCPAVRFQWEGQTRIAHLFDPQVPFGSPYEPASSVKLAESASYILEPITFRLSYRDNIYPEEEKSLLMKTYRPEDVVGRQIHLGFYHGLDLMEQASTSFSQVRVFTPVMSTEGPDLTEEIKNELAALGQTITLEAQRIDVDPEQKVIRVNEFPIGWGEGSSRPQEVTEMKLRITAGLPSLVKLEIWPVDSQGKEVKGLIASDFSFSENGQIISPLMEANEIAPKVLILYDTSLSMPLEYRKEGMEEFLEILEATLRQEYPKASVTSWATDSNLYTWLRKASQTSFDLILFATDGDNKEDLQEGDLETFAAAPPVIVLDVFNSQRASSQEVFKNLSISSGGKIINAENQALARQEIIQLLALLELPPYVFTFYGSLQQESNTVQVSLDTSRVSVEESYEFRVKPESKTTGPKVVGIYLTVQIGSQNIDRVLAGWDPTLENPDEISKVHSDAVRNLLFGSVVIGVEGQGPTYATALNELLDFRLRNQSWIEASKNESLEAATDEIEKLNWTYDPIMLHLLAPLPDAVSEDSLTFASGIRMVIVKRTTGIGSEFSEDSVDILPSGNFITLSDHAEESFKINLKKTGHLAIVEHAFFEESTYSLLSQSNLVSAEAASKEPWFEEQLRNGPHGTFIREYWSRSGGTFKIFGKELDSLAYWQIDKKTGELLGILPDLTGGGKRKIYTRYDDLNKVLQNYTRTLKKNPGRSVTIWAAHLILLKLYAIAAHAIKTMDTTNLEADVLRALQMDACDAARFIHGGMTGRPQKIMGGLANLIRLMDRKSDDFPCT